MLSFLSQSSAHKNELAKVDEFQAGNQRRLTRVVEEKTAAEAERTQLGSAGEELQRRIEERQSELDKLAERRTQIQGEISELKTRSEERRDEAERLRDELSRLRARRESLEEILSHHAS